MNKFVAMFLFGFLSLLLLPLLVLVTHAFMLMLSTIVILGAPHLLTLFGTVPVRFLVTPGLWLGLIVVAAVRLRRDHTPI